MKRHLYYRLITDDGYWAVISTNEPYLENFVKTFYDEKQQPHNVIGAVMLNDFKEDSGPWSGWDDPEEELYTLEVCPHCMAEIWIWANKSSTCRVCGKPMLPCTTCYDHLPGYKGCNWSENAGCWRFPVGN